MHGIELSVEYRISVPGLRRILQKVLLQIIHNHTAVHAAADKPPAAAVHVHAVEPRGAVAQADHRQRRALAGVPELDHAGLLAGADEIARGPVQPH